MITEDGCVIVAPAEGMEVGSVSGAPTVMKATGDETGDVAAVFEQATPARSGPPLHIHHDSAEMFYVLEGEFIFMAGSDRIRAPEGTFVFVPKGVAHSYFNTGDSTARILYWFTPAARMTGYFTELAGLAHAQIDRSELDAIARRHGVEIVGDPLDHTE